MRRYGGILIEGSSSATGLFDESRRGGFGGRIESHYDAYNEFSALDIQQDPAWVFVFRNGQPDLKPCGIAKNMHARRNEIRTCNIQKLLGVFVIGIMSDYDVYKWGRQQSINRWISGLNQLEDAIVEQNIEPIFMTSPRYSRDTPLRIPAKHDPELYEEYLLYTKGMAYALHAPLVSFEQAMGGTLQEYGAIDRRHVNAAAHQHIADFLIPVLDHKLGIIEDPSAETLLESSTVRSAELF